MEKKIDNIAAAVLAGGKNLRMAGKDKAFIPVKGIPVIERTITLLKKMFKEIIIVTNTAGSYNSYKSEVVITDDKIKNIGPLGGMYSALSTTNKEGVFFVACDMPFLHNGLILCQIEVFNTCKGDVVVPRIGGLIEPLHAVYRTSLKDKIGNFINDNTNYSVKKFLGTIDVYYWDLEDTPFYRNIFRNLNTPVDFKLTCDPANGGGSNLGEVFLCK